VALKEIIRAFSIRQFLKLATVFIKKPLLIFPTYKATSSTIKICNKAYGWKHHGDNKANAFRHALWNYLLSLQYYRTLKSEEKALDWSRKITDFHEDISPNSSLVRAMDLHNNSIGRNLFSARNSEENMIEKLKFMSKEALKIRSIVEIKSAEQKLVYIAD